MPKRKNSGEVTVQRRRKSSTRPTTTAKRPTRKK